MFLFALPGWQSKFGPDWISHFVCLPVGEPEETPAELRERFARVYKERNELRQQVETLSKVEAQLKTAQVIKKQQHKKIERLEQDLVLFNQLQTQVRALRKFFSTLPDLHNK